MPFSPEISSQTTLGGEDQSLVTFKILLGSNDIAPLLGVIGITIQRAVNKVAYAILNIADGDLPQQKMPVSDSDWFVIGQEVEIKVGYHMRETTLFKGIVTASRIDYRNEGPLSKNDRYAPKYLLL
jgi:hypothetical protein